MLILVDENLPVILTDALREDGHDVVEVNDLGMAGAADPDVFNVAQEQGRILITGDRGLGNMLQYRPKPPCGIVIFRFPEATSAIKRAETIRGFVSSKAANELGGCISVVDPDGHRVRTLHVGA